MSESVCMTKILVVKLKGGSSHDRRRCCAPFRAAASLSCVCDKALIGCCRHSETAAVGQHGDKLDVFVRYGKKEPCPHSGDASAQPSKWVTPNIELPLAEDERNAERSCLYLRG